MILIVSVNVSITGVYLIYQWLKLLDLMRINVVARMVPPISKYKMLLIELCEVLYEGSFQV
jgi:hypothetical protein